MDIKDLRYFKTIAECGSFSNAAAHLRIAQPALSRKIGKMEHALGVTPTDAGRVLLARALKIEHDFDEERRRGAKIAARGIYSDPTRSSHGHSSRRVACAGPRGAWLRLGRRTAPCPY